MTRAVSRPTRSTRPARAAKPPTGIFARGNVLWARYKNAEGKWDNVSLGLRLGQEQEAAELLAAIKRQVSTGREVGLELSQSHPTFRKFFTWWIDRRKARKLRAWRDDESRIRTHVLEHLGAMKLDEVTPLHLEKVFVLMRDRGRAPKTVWNTYSSVRALFRDAVKKGFLRQSPCLLGEEELGPMVDKDPEWRETAIYSRDEIAGLMFDPRIPADRRLFYACSYLAGRRLGEVSGLRFRHVDLTAEPLGAIVFARSYARGPTKTNTTVRMPIHPVLADLLHAWIDHGFHDFLGRDPTPDDFVIPRPPDCTSKFGAARDKNFVRKQLIKDLEALDLRHRRTHDLRRSFISHAQQNGAQPNVLIRLTHPSTKKATAFAGYTEFAWEDYCTEVAKLHVDVPPPRPTTEAARAVAVAVVTTAAAVGADAASPATSEADDDPAEADDPAPWRGPRLQLVTPLVTTKAKAQEFPGLSQWRRRESNPLTAALSTLRHRCLFAVRGGDSGAFLGRRARLGST